MKKDKKIVSLFFAVFFAITFGLGIIMSHTAKAETSVGFAAGGTRGVGATFRHLSNESPWGWQVTGLPFIHPDRGVVSLGGQALYVLHRGQEGMAYASLGVGSIIMWDKCTEEELKEDVHCEDERNWGVGAGPGVGFELRMVDNVALAVDIPLAVMFSNEGFFGVLPVPNAALTYYW